MSIDTCHARVRLLYQYTITTTTTTTTSYNTRLFKSGEDGSFVVRQAAAQATPLEAVEAQELGNGGAGASVKVSQHSIQLLLFLT